MSINFVDYCTLLNWPLVCKSAFRIIYWVSVDVLHACSQVLRAVSLAGLMHLEVAFAQPASANVSTSLSALTCLTYLGLEGLLHFRQQGGYSGGAMVSLMQHMRQLRLQADFSTSDAKGFWMIEFAVRRT